MRVLCVIIDLKYKIDSCYILCYEACREFKKIPLINGILAQQG